MAGTAAADLTGLLFVIITLDTRMAALADDDFLTPTLVLALWPSAWISVAKLLRGVAL